MYPNNTPKPNTMNVCLEKKELDVPFTLLPFDPLANCPFRRVNPPFMAMVDARCCMVATGGERFDNSVRVIRSE